MFVLGVCGLKGGVGKSTIAQNVACALHREGRRVLLVDADPQGTSRAWRARAVASDLDGPTVVSLECTKGTTLRADVARIGASFEVVVLDSPARLGQETRATMLAADVVLLPVIPGGADFWALEDKTLPLVRQAQELRPELRAAVVLNCTDRTVLARHAEAALGKLDVPVFDARLGSRVAFGEAMLAGKGVVDNDHGSTAAREVRRLVRETLAFGGAP